MTEGPNRGYSYMRRRGIEDRTIKKNLVWDMRLTAGILCMDILRKRELMKNCSLELGLLSQKDGRYFDKFRDRVIFPIINTAGKVIGFGGRALDDKAMPKYLNSPENRVFQKK